MGQEYNFNLEEFYLAVNYIKWIYILRCLFYNILKIQNDLS